MTELGPWRPFATIEPFRKEMESLVERFFGGDANGWPDPAAQAWTPRVDIEETEREIVVTADLPGVDAKAVEVTVQCGILTVRGEKKDEKDEKRTNYHRVERFAGSFYRAIALPPGADADKVHAASAHGVVTITIPKKPDGQPKKIAVAQR